MRNSTDTRVFCADTARFSQLLIGGRFSGLIGIAMLRAIAAAAPRE